MSEELLTFESNGLRLFGMLHRPDGEVRCGVVFCHPFGEEKKTSHRTLVTTAREMAKRGIATLRFDYGGCGDSEGEFRNATLSSRLADLKCALGVLGREVVPPRTGVLGLRLGAALAARTAEAEDNVGFVVLWEPVIDGKGYFMADLRRKLVKEMMTRGRSSVNREEILKSLDSDEAEIDFDGYVVSGALYRELTQLNVQGELGKFKGRALLVQISFKEKLGAPISALSQAYADAGAQPSLVPVVEEPIWNRIDLVETPNLIGRTIEWIESEALAE